MLIRFYWMKQCHPIQYCLITITYMYQNKETEKSMYSSDHKYCK